MEFLTLKKSDQKVVKEINLLLPQLSSSKLFVTKARLQKVFDSPAVEVTALKEKGRIVGVASLIFVQQLDGKKALIEDVVIDKFYRGKGLGKVLVSSLIRRAKRNKASEVRLTSRPERVAANILYKKLGFKPKNTNYYVLKL